MKAARSSATVTNAPRARSTRRQRDQLLVRSQSDELAIAAKRVASKVGGRLVTKHVNHDGHWVGYLITLRRGVTVDIPRLQRAVAGDGATVFHAGHRRGAGIPIGMCAIDGRLDAVRLWCPRWTEQLQTLLQRIDRACGAGVTLVADDVIMLRLDRRPANPVPLARAIRRLCPGLDETVAEIVAALNRRDVLLWLD